MTHTPSHYQQAIYDFIQNGKGNLIVKADAGTGKTYTIKTSINYIPKNKSILVVAFSKAIEMELKKEIPSYAQVSTFHSLGLKAIYSAFGKTKIDTSKLFKITTSIINENEKKYISPIMKMVSHLKNNLLPPTKKSIETLAYHHNLDLPANFERYVQLVRKVYEKSIDNTKTVDFDDMVCFPYLFNFSCKKYDFILIDECQDNAPAQNDLILRSIKRKGRVFGFGDENQSIFGFREADTKSIPKLIKILKATTLPLSICYRCPKSHIRLAQRFVPTIEAKSDAKEGKIINLKEEHLYKYVQPGDLIICRNNAPLIEPCLSLLKKGVKVTIKGNDIGKNLITLVKKFRARTIPELKQLISEWEKNEIKKANKKNQNPQYIEDKADCLFSFIENSGAKTPAQVAEYIKAIFSDDKAEIVFSSIHKAKGLEAENVFFLQPNLIPSKYAEQEWEFIQEQNLYYVAITRAKENLYMVN